MKPRFFLRFYNVPKEHVESFAASFKGMFPVITRYTIGPITQSVNMFLPEGNGNWEMFLYFKTEADRDAVYRSPEGKAFYVKNATPIKGATLVLQNSKSPAFKYK